MQVTTVADVRRTCGITKDLIDDDDVQKTIERAEKELGKILNTSIKPKTVIEVVTPNQRVDTEVILLKHNPVLQVKDVKINGTSVSPQYISVYEGSGKLILKSGAEETHFDVNKTQNNAIKYVYGLIEPGDEETATTAEITSPDDDTSISVSDGSKFKIGDWVRVEGMDGYYEVTQVSAQAATTITADLAFPHESGSRVILMEVPGDVKRLLEITTGLMLVAREVGASFKDIVGYTLGDRSIQKGEPYTQWRETHVQLRKEYEALMQARRPRPFVG